MEVMKRLSPHRLVPIARPEGRLTVVVQRMGRRRRPGLRRHLARCSFSMVAARLGGARERRGHCLLHFRACRDGAAPRWRRCHGGARGATLCLGSASGATLCLASASAFAWPPPLLQPLPPALINYLLATCNLAAPSLLIHSLTN